MADIPNPSPALTKWQEQGYPISDLIMQLTEAEMHWAKNNPDIPFGARRLIQDLLNPETTYSEVMKTLYQYNLILNHQGKLKKAKPQDDETELTEYTEIDKQIISKTIELLNDKKQFALPQKPNSRLKYLKVITPDVSNKQDI